MEAAIGQNLQFPKWINQEKLTRMPSASLRCTQICRKEKLSQMLVPRDSQVKKGLTSSRRIVMEISYSRKKFSASTRDFGSYFASLDEGLVLKNKAQEIMPYLDGRSIYLVGMMGSGKTTVGKILSEVLEYSFCDSDLLVEGNAGGMSVAEIFKLYGEGYFRVKESEALRYLSLMHRLVVSTGGGAVTRPINWNYMHKGISVYIDVPLEALAQRIAAVGTASRPLLHEESGDAYTKAFTRLSTLLEERGDAYANANTTVSLESIAAKLGHRDVSNLTPTIIAIEALEQIEVFLKDEEDRNITAVIAHC